MRVPERFWKRPRLAARVIGRRVQLCDFQPMTDARALCRFEAVPMRIFSWIFFHPFLFVESRRRARSTYYYARYKHRCVIITTKPKPKPSHQWS